MMLDSKCLIGDLEDLCSYKLHIRPKCIVDAIKAVRMWEQLKKDYGQFDIRERDGMSDIPLVARMKGLERTYFPHFVLQILKVAIKGEDAKSLHRTRELIQCIEGVDEVRL